MKIIMGSDHRGFDLKNKIFDYLSGRYTIDDAGCYNVDSVDYPDYAITVAEAVSQREYDRGILVCGSGIGMSIAANKTKGIRAALCFCAETSMRARKHNDANILCLGADFMREEEALKAVDNFINTDFEGGRHQDRLDKIE